MNDNERPTPLTDAEASRIGGHSQPSDRVSADFARTLERSLAILRVAFGIADDERIPEQTPQFGSVLVDKGSTRRRIAPISDEIIQLERSLAERTEERDKLLEKQSWLIAHPTAIEAAHQVVEWTKCEQDRDTALAKLAESEAHAKRLQDRLAEVQAEKSDALIAAVENLVASDAKLAKCIEALESASDELKSFGESEADAFYRQTLEEIK